MPRSQTARNDMSIAQLTAKADLLLTDFVSVIDEMAQLLRGGATK